MEITEKIKMLVKLELRKCRSLPPKPCASAIISSLCQYMSAITPFAAFPVDTSRIYPIL
jgi:hypothetical protein